MPCDYPEALDQIFSLVDDCNSGSVETVLGYAPRVFWMGDNSGDVPDKSKYWVRVVAPLVKTVQRTFSPDRKIYLNYGVFVLECFAPKSDPASAVNLRLIAGLFMNAIRDGSANVFIRDATIVEQPFSPIQQSVVVSAQYEFFSL